MANIKIKLGIFELDCEGPEAFLKAEVPNFLKLALETHRQLPAAVIPPASAPANVQHKGHENAKVAFQGTTETLAAKIGVKKGPDLAVAAAARLVFVLGKDSFTRDELHGEMKTATAYYNKNHLSNLTQTLQSLVKAGTFNGIAADNYALSANAKTEIGAKIRG